MNLPTHTRIEFHQGYFQRMTFITLPEAAPRYGHMIGCAAIDVPPTNAHGWFNRAVALTQWAMRCPHSRLIRQCIRESLRMYRELAT